jgi:hypothetical protein
MKKLFYALLAAATIAASPGLAKEPGTPTMMPSGGSIGVPIGANPPPGLYFIQRSEYFTGNVYQGDLKLPVELRVISSAQQLHWVPGFELFGGSYRAALNIPLVQVEETAPNGATNTEAGVGDVIISPLNVSWMLQPGVFVQSGLSISLPTGKFDAAPGSVNLGSNAPSAAIDVGFSYLRDGWNLSAHANYIMYGENKDTDYKSGNEIMLNWTAMKEVGNGFSIGPVGYFRKQVTDDENNGFAYGGSTSGHAEQYGIGVGLSKRFGPMELNVNYVHDYHVRNTAGGDKFLVNFTTRLGKPPSQGRP